MGNCFSGPAERGGKKARESNSHELQTYEPVCYQSDPEAIRNPNRMVNRVHFIAYKLLENGGNHWVIYLQTAPEKSVRINMEPSALLGAQVPGHGYRGEMAIFHRNHGTTYNQECSVTIPATKGNSVATFIDAIIDAGNHEFDFTTEGRGCTGWILDQFHLFLQLGLIPPGFDILETAINQEWASGRPRSERPSTRGFYMRETRGGGWGRSTSHQQ